MGVPKISDLAMIEGNGTGDVDRSSYTEVPDRKIDTIVIHDGGHPCSVNFALSHIDGEAVPLPLVAWHTGNWQVDLRSIAIDIGTEPLTNEQVEELRTLVRGLIDEYDIKSERVMRHKDVTGMDCPVAYTDNDSWMGLKGRILALRSSHDYTR